ncbi:uncharacterized protein LOC143291547 [Babylonia areolata]|uniref:uncharacterized protein LOC143291547 n=1 Tax=Babylonia areolata TaxID=304850 RepID=UPI003FD3752C
MWKWMDGTIAYYLGMRHHIREKAEVGAILGPHSTVQFDHWLPRYQVRNSLVVAYTDVTPSESVAYLCEDDRGRDFTNVYDKQTSVIQLSDVEDFTSGRARLLQCPDNHTTHDFLSCNVQSDCWARDQVTCHVPGLSSLPPMYLCARGTSRIAYSQVCDFRKDCPENSDEDFCVYPSCRHGEIQCGNKEV